MISIAQKLAEIALELQVVKLSPDKPFTWTSGYKMPIYNDNRLFLSDAEHRQTIAEGFVNLIQKNELQFDVIAGTATAGIPHATTLADMLRLPLVYVRSTAKGHGMKNLVEGGLKAGQKVLVIEDLISTGGSSIAAVNGLREQEAIVDTCLSIFTYGFSKASEKFQENNCASFSLLTFPVLLEVAIEKKYITEAQAEDLRSWQDSPFTWGEGK